MSQENDQVRHSPIDKKIGESVYVGDATFCTKFGASPFERLYSPPSLAAYIHNEIRELRIYSAKPLDTY